LLVRTPKECGFGPITINSFESVFVVKHKRPKARNTNMDDWKALTNARRNAWIAACDRRLLARAKSPRLCGKRVPRRAPPAQGDFIRKGWVWVT